MNCLEDTAIVLIKESIQDAENQGYLLPDGLQKEFCKNEPFKASITALLNETQKLTDDTINKWDQINVAQMKAYTDGACSSKAEYKQRVINNQIIFILSDLFYGLSDRVLYEPTHEVSQQGHYKELVAEYVTSLSPPAWRARVLLPLRYPGIYNAMEKGVAKTLMNLIPFSYRQALENAIEEKGCSVAIRNTNRQMPNWIASKEIDHRNIKKMMLMGLLTSSIVNHEDLLILSTQHWSIEPNIFSQEAFDSFLEPLVSIEDIFQHSISPNEHIQTHTHRFFDDIKQRLQENGP